MLLPAELEPILSPKFLNSLNDEELQQLAKCLDELEKLDKETKLFQLYPDQGPLRRELYPKHLSFFRAGTQFMERACVSANRVGKTWGIGGFETAVHLTGEYPEWWNGRRFDHPIDCWAAGDTSETTRDIIQHALVGPIGELGTGLIPAANIIGEPTKRSGVSGAMDTVRVRHKTGGVSQVGLKSFDQGRKKFQGTSKHLIWLDEECPEDVYDECLLRLMTLRGLMMLTFTPLDGLTPVVLRFMPHLTPTLTG